MDLTKSILVDVRESIGLNADDTSFDPDIIPLINTSLGKLNQNGVGRILVVSDDKQTWNDLIDESQTTGNKVFSLVPGYVILSTKLIFDPPPPSMVEYYSRFVDESLWRLKLAYEIGE